MKGISTVNCRSIAIPVKGENGEEGLDQKDEGQELNEGPSGSKRSDLWMHAGKFAKAEPKLLQWEVSHLLDGMLPRMSFFKFLDKIALGGGITDSIHTGRKRISPPQDLFDLIQVSVTHVFQSRPLRISSVHDRIGACCQRCSYEAPGDHSNSYLFTHTYLISHTAT